MSVESQMSSPKLLTVEVELNGVLTKMEVDTGAAVSLITKKTWHRIKENLQIFQQNVKLTDYNGKPIITVGRVQILVQHHGQSIILPAIVVKDGTCDLMGRDWLVHLRLDWEKIFAVNAIAKDEIGQMVVWFEKFPKVFNEKLGKYIGPKVHINKLPNCSPIFMR